MRKFMITVNGNTYEVDVDEVKDGAPTAAPVTPVAAPKPAPVSAAPTAKAAPAPAAKPIVGGETIKAPMPGNILAVNVQTGVSVKRGDVLLVLEAMKMENEIMSPRDGKVAQVVVSKGTTVNSGDALVVLE